MATSRKPKVTLVSQELKNLITQNSHSTSAVFFHQLNKDRVQERNEHDVQWHNPLYVPTPFSSENFLGAVRSLEHCATSKWDQIVISLESLSKQLVSNLDKNQSVDYLMNSAISQYYDGICAKTDFSTLMDPDLSSSLTSTIPVIVSYAMMLPSLLAEPIPILKKHENRTILLTKNLICSLIANAFFCTLEEKTGMDIINFHRMFNSKPNGEYKAEQLKCIINYIQQMREKTGNCGRGIVSFERRIAPPNKNWSSIFPTLTAAEVEFNNISEKPSGMLLVDLSDSRVGGCVMNKGSQMEKILFAICPELIISRLFTEPLEQDEIIVIKGAEEFNKITEHFLYEGPAVKVCETKIDNLGRIMSPVEAMEGLYLKTHRMEKLYEENLEQKVHNAFVVVIIPDEEQSISKETFNRERIPRESFSISDLEPNHPTAAPICADLNQQVRVKLVHLYGIEQSTISYLIHLLFYFNHESRKEFYDNEYMSPFVKSLTTCLKENDDKDFKRLCDGSRKCIFDHCETAEFHEKMDKAYTIYIESRLKSDTLLIQILDQGDMKSDFVPGLLKGLRNIVENVSLQQKTEIIKVVEEEVKRYAIFNKEITEIYYTKTVAKTGPSHGGSLLATTIQFKDAFSVCWEEMAQWWDSKQSGSDCAANVIAALMPVIFGIAGAAAGAALEATVPINHGVNLMSGLHVGIKFGKKSGEWFSDFIRKYFGSDKETTLQLAYSYFGANSETPDENIRRKFKQLALIHHPDKGGDEKEFCILKLHMNTIKLNRQVNGGLQNQRHTTQVSDVKDGASPPHSNSFTTTASPKQQLASLVPPSRKHNATTSPVEIKKDLNKLGKFHCLPHESQKFQLILKYVNNSSGIKDSEGRITLHNVYEINKNDFISFLKRLYSFGESDSEQQLLWFKTTSKGIQRLAEHNDGCVAFYDRMCRAMPENHNKMQSPTRQLMILCAVSLGKVYESPHGFQHWSSVGSVPDGFSTVKGTGKFVPYCGDAVADDSVIVPCGKTIQNQKFQSYKLDFNEYIAFDAVRVKVKYAVDVEITLVKSKA